MPDTSRSAQVPHDPVKSKRDDREEKDWLTFETFPYVNIVLLGTSRRKRKKIQKVNGGGTITYPGRPQRTVSMRDAVNGKRESKAAARDFC